MIKSDTLKTEFGRFQNETIEYCEQYACNTYHNPGGIINHTLYTHKFATVCIHDIKYRNEYIPNYAKVHFQGLE